MPQRGADLAHDGGVGVDRAALGVDARHGCQQVVQTIQESVDLRRGGAHDGSAVDAGFRTGLASAGTGFPCGESARRMWSLSKRWMKCMGMVAPW